MNDINNLLHTDVIQNTILLSEESVPLKFNKIRELILLTQEMKELQEKVDRYNNSGMGKEDFELELVLPILKYKFIRK